MRRRWTEERIRRELETSLPGWEVWPPYPMFRASGRRGLWQAILERGGLERFAEEYGLPYRRNDRALSDAEIRARLREVLRGSDVAQWPSRAWLRRRAGSQLVTAIDRAGCAERWARELGLPLCDGFGHRRGEPWTPAASAAALASLLDGRATWPSRREFEAAGLAELYIAITETEGHAAMAARYGLPLQRPRRRRASPRRSTPPAE